MKLKICTRCGRYGHDNLGCFYLVDINGNILPPETAVKPKQLI